MKSLLIAIGMVGALFAAPGAWAQEDEPDPAPWITMKSTSGCTFFLYDYDDPSGSWQKQHKWTWTGGCTGGVATGSGDLTAVMSYDSGETYTSGYRGTLVGGRMNGRVEEITNGKMPAALLLADIRDGLRHGGPVRLLQAVHGRGAASAEDSSLQRGYGGEREDAGEGGPCDDPRRSQRGAGGSRVRGAQGAGGDRRD